MDNYKEKYEGLLSRIKTMASAQPSITKAAIESLFPEIAESEDDRIRKEIQSVIEQLDKDSTICGKKYDYNRWLAWFKKQSTEPKWCHHKVDLSDCSDEYRKAYYDGWNNCNMQHSQCRSELDDVVKCLINGMKFYYEDNKEATWGTEKWSMPVKHIIEVLEKQSTPQVRTGLEWVNTIDDACDKRYLEEYAHGEYCHEQSFKWGFQEGVDWLKKQGTPAKLSEEEQNRFAKGVLTSCALSFIDFLDAHKHEGKMCMSNGECEDIENAFQNAMWDRLHRYYCKYIEKQGEQKPVTDFSDLRTWKYIVDAVWTEKEGIGQYLDSPFTEEVAKKLQKRFGNIEQKPAEEYNITGINSKKAQGKLGEMIKKLEPINDVLEQKPDDVRTTGYWNVQDVEIPFGAKDSELMETTYNIPKGFHAEIEGNNVVIKKGEQKPTWSEEDREMARFIGNAITTEESSDYLKQKNIEVIDAHVWLDSLKDRVQPKPEWSEEDNQYLCGLIGLIEQSKAEIPITLKGKAADNCIDWLESLRPQKNEALPQWRRLPLNSISYAPDSWRVMDVITSTNGANSASVSALVKGDYYVPLFELEKFIKNV